MRMIILLSVLLTASSYCIKAKAANLSLRDALKRTLQHDIALQAFPYQIRIAEAEQIQAAKRPNPQLNINVENIVGSGENRALSGAELALSLSQLVELGQKRERRITLASWQSQLQRDQYEINRLDALATTTAHYLHLLHLQQLEQWAKQKIKRQGALLNIAHKRTQAGNLQEADISRIRLRLAHSKLELAQLKRDIQRGQYQLAARWNAEPDFAAVNGDISAMPTVPDLSELQNRLQQSPTVQRYQTLQQIAASQLALAQASNKADISVSGGVKYNAALNDTSVMLGVSIPLQFQLPYYGQQLAATAEQQLQATRHQLNLRQLDLQLQQHWLSLQQLRDETLTLSRQLLPEAAQLQQLSRNAYQQGQIDLLSLLSAEDEYLQMQRQLIDSQSQYHLTLLQLERLSGQPMIATSAQNPSATE